MPGLEISLTVYANEAALLEGIRRNEPDACTCMIKYFIQPLYSHALRIVGDADDAESVVQLAFMKACAKLDTFEGRSSLKSWLRSIVANEALMLLRSRHPTVALDELAETIQSDETSPTRASWPPDPADSALHTELQAQLKAALARLPESLRMVFVLREIQGYSTEETAIALGLGESAVKVRLHRARIRLRELLTDYLADGDSHVTTGHLDAS